MERELHTISEACELLRVGKTKLYELLHAGALTSIRYPDTDKRLIQRTELDRFLEACKEKTPSEDEAESTYHDNRF